MWKCIGFSLISVEAELPVHDLQLIACSSIGLYCRNFVQRSRVERAIFFSLGSAKGFIPEVPYELGIDGADEDPGIGKP